MEKTEVVSNTVSGRFLCNIFEDMRACIKVMNFSYLPGLIEEAQYRANRMETIIDRNMDWKRMQQNYERIKKDVEELRKERSALKKELGKEDTSSYV